MGAYCPVPFADDNVLAAIRRDIVDPTLRGLQNEQFEFRGFLYFGIMLTPTGPKLLEYNVRLGDPEAEVLLPALDSSLLDLIEGHAQRHACPAGRAAAARRVRGRGAGLGRLPGRRSFPPASPSPASTTCPPACSAYHGATRRNEAGQLVTNGGRVLVLTAHGHDLEDGHGPRLRGVQPRQLPGYVRAARHCPAPRAGAKQHRCKLRG